MLRTQPLAIVRSLTQSQRTRGPKGYSDDAAEDGFVFVPANAGAGRILADEDLSEVLGVSFSEVRNLLSQRKQPLGYRIRKREAPRDKVVPPAEGDNPSIRFEAKIGRASCRERV